MLGRLPEWAVARPKLTQGRRLAAYQVQPCEDLTLSVQYYAELMAHYRAYLDTLPPGFPARDRYR